MLTLPGYETACVDVTTRVTSGGYDAVYIVFQITKLLPIDAEHFPDAIFRAYVAENFDLDGDGYLTDAEREEALGRENVEGAVRAMKRLSEAP